MHHGKNSLKKRAVQPRGPILQKVEPQVRHQALLESVIPHAHFRLIGNVNQVSSSAKLSDPSSGPAATAT